MNAVVKRLNCRWGDYCYECNADDDEMEGLQLSSLVSRFAHLTELVLQIPLSTLALRDILQECDLNLVKLDYHSEKRATTTSPLPSLQKLTQLTIRFDCVTTDNRETMYTPKCTSDIFSFRSGLYLSSQDGDLLLHFGTP
jgi:hypothetical protein